MNQLAVIDDITERRRAAARKAVETRRARTQGVAPMAHINAAPAHKNAAAEALAAFEHESSAAMPDWHKVALALRRALTQQPQTPSKKLTRAPAALPAPAWHDYPVNHLSWKRCRNPTIIVTFADGIVVRAPAVSAVDKPLNIGRALREAIAFYQAKAARLRVGKRIWPRAPAITACICEETGETFDPEQCTLRTVETRKAKPR